jgi:molybdate transport system substrate-binding protein
MAHRLLAAALSMLLGMGASTSPTPPLRVAAASDLRQALPVLAADYQRRSGVSVEATFGSSGKLFAQIENGAPFDAYFSANAAFPRKLEASGLTVPGTRFPYAVGRLVLWTQRGSGVAVGKGLSVLTDARVTKVAIANPAHAPYGQAAVEALRHAGIYDRV